MSSTDPTPSVPTTPPAATAVVTGAAGWLGQNLVRTLLRSRDRVRCLVASPDEAPALAVLSPKVETVVGDVRDPGTADRLFEGVGEAAVFHAAAVIHPAKSTREFFDVNVGGTQIDRRPGPAGLRRPVRARVVQLAVRHEPDARRRVHRGLAVRPVHGLRQVQAGGRADRPQGARARRHPDRDRAGALVLRPVPAAAADRSSSRRSARACSRSSATAPSSARWPTPTTWCRACCGPRCPRRRRATPTGWPTPSPTRCARSSRRSAWRWPPRACRSKPARLRLPRRGRPLRREGRRRPAGPRASYVQALHVLGELGHTIACDISRARDELGYEPTVELARACGPASAGASTTGRAL